MTQVINAGRVLTLFLSIAGFIAWVLAVDQAQGRDSTLRSGELMQLLLAGVPLKSRALLLKGLGLKEIADAGLTRERTVRQLARAVYRKAELPGHASLSAFLLDGLGLPAGDDVGLQ